VLCVGSSQAFGGPGETLRALHSRMAPGGLALYGDGFWARTPDAAALGLIGELPGYDELLELARGARLRVEHADRSTATAPRTRPTPRRSGLETSGDPDAVALAAERKHEYEHGYRGALGFAWLVLAAG
jgi:hypothetical protein